MLSRFYRVPASTVQSWSTRELAVNWYIALHTLQRFAGKLSEDPDALIVPVLQLHPLG